MSVLFCTSAKSGMDTPMLRNASLSYFTRSATTPSGFDTPPGLSNTWLTTLKIAVLAPIPSAKAATAVRLNAGLLASVRQVMRRADDIDAILLFNQVRSASRERCINVLLAKRTMVTRLGLHAWGHTPGITNLRSCIR